MTAEQTHGDEDRAGAAGVPAPDRDAERGAADRPAGPAVAGRTLPTVLVVIASITLLLGILASWANRQLLDTGNWVTTSGKLIEDKRVRDALAPYLVDQLYQHVDVPAELQQVLPSQLRPLAGPAASGLRQLAQQGAQDALGSSLVQNLWKDANRTAHRALVAVVEGGHGPVSTSNGTVQLDLGTLVRNLGGRLGVSSALLAKIPSDTGNITILKSKQLQTAQTAVEALRGLLVILVVATVGLYVFAVVAARGRRRRTVMAIGASAILVGVLVLVARSVAGGIVVDDLATTQNVVPAAEAVWSIGTSLLVSVATAIMFFGALLILGGWLGGPTRPATAFRRNVAPFAREYPLATYGALLLLALLLIVVKPFGAATSPIGALVLIGLAIVAAWALRRETAREFPDASRDDLAQRMRGRLDRAGTSVAGGARQVRDRVTAARDERVAARAEARARAAEEAPTAVVPAALAPAPAPTAVAASAPAAAASPEDERLRRLERLAALRDAGALDDAEFAAEKARVLGEG